VTVIYIDKLPADPEVVAALREMLAAAQAGRLTAFTAVAHLRDEDEPAFYWPGEMNFYEMSGQLMQLARDIVLDEDDVDDD
jgi:hypothetical protein